MNSSISKEEFLKKELKDISQVYSGKRECCRCGCGGTYTATSFMEGPRSEVNNSLVQKRLDRAKRLVLAGADIQTGDNFFDIQTGNDRCLCFYFDELKK